MVELQQMMPSFASLSDFIRYLRNLKVVCIIRQLNNGNNKLEVMPSAATAAKRQQLTDLAKSWLIIETKTKLLKLSLSHKNGEALMISCKLCSTWQQKVQRSRNNDTITSGTEGKAAIK